uniref:TEA domain-containing protein n=1 Tax=Glossina austeni TaxID=7395 RepID=A0A1A9VRY9_GLOAU
MDIFWAQDAQNICSKAAYLSTIIIRNRSVLKVHFFIQFCFSGRNELIARYIKLRTGKTRTRKQVSSHIQVLARRKLREIQAKLKVEPNGIIGGAGPNNAAALHLLSEKEKALQAMAGMTSSQIVSAQAVKNLALAASALTGLHHHPVHPHSHHHHHHHHHHHAPPPPPPPTTTTTTTTTSTPQPPPPPPQPPPPRLPFTSQSHNEHDRRQLNQYFEIRPKFDIRTNFTTAKYSNEHFASYNNSYYPKFYVYVLATASTAIGRFSICLKFGNGGVVSTFIHGRKIQFWQPGLQPSSSQDLYDYSIKPFAQQAYPAGKPSTAVSGDIEAGLPPAQLPWEGRAIATHKFRLLEFSAFMEIRREDIYHRHLFVQLGGKPSFSDPLLETVDIRQIFDKFPEKSGGLKDLYEKGPQNAFYLVKCWADLNTEISGSDTGDFYGVTSQYESNENVVLVCSTKVCSFGSQVVEKVETEFSRLENGRFVYRIDRSPMCEYMINFIQKLKNLPERYMMNSVLENFTILQVIQARETQETLLCIAYVFEVAAQNSGATHHIYRLIKE